MKKKTYFVLSGILFLLFIVLTLLLCCVDVQNAGPEGSRIGIARLNLYMFKLLGTHLLWYSITDWLGLAAIATAGAFAVLGCVQLIKRKSLWAVDRSLLILGGIYLCVFTAYFFFEKCIVNYRPILLHGSLEASFPSSHTMIVFCIMLTAISQFKQHIRPRWLRLFLNALAIAIIALTIIGRIISGVHWFTDIIGGLLLGGAFALLYRALIPEENPSPAP